MSIRDVAIPTIRSRAPVAPCSCHLRAGNPWARLRVPPAGDMLAARMRCAGMRVKAVSGARAVIVCELLIEASCTVPWQDKLQELCD